VNKYLHEFIGTFFLVFTIGAAVVGAPAMAPYIIGGTLIALVYACGHGSAAHFNPGVTLAMFMRRRSPASDVVPYIIAQILAATAAAFVVRVLFEVPAVPADRPLAASILAETLWTFILVWVILNVAAARGTAGNTFYGLAIGTVVMGGAATVGPISGGAFNTAAGLGMWLMNFETLGQFGLFTITNVVGAVSAALVFGVTEGPPETTQRCALASDSLPTKRDAG